MRSFRRFAPALDCLQIRIAPSTFVGGLPVLSGSPPVATKMDDTGSPGGEPSGDGHYPIIMTSPVGTSTTGSVC